MNKHLSSFLLMLSFVFCLSAVAFGQQQVGTIEGTVKDVKGAAIPGTTVTITGVSVGFERKVQSDAEGVYRVLQVPAGTYRVVTAATSGFAAATLENVTVVIEKTTTADVTVGISETVNTVEVAGDPLGVIVDTTDSKVQTNITSQLIERLPTGTSFTSLLKISPATRSEPLSGGFQVDGASGSENTFIIDGQPMENFRTGVLNGVNAIPTSLVSEVQIKTGGFEAEHGGASGGVITVSTKSGSNKFHGEGGSSFEPSSLQPAPRFLPSAFVNSASNLAFQYHPYAIAQPKDKYTNYYPTLQFSGPILKKKVWFFGTYAPQIFKTQRKSTFYKAIAESNFSTGPLVLTPQVNGSSITTQIDGTAGTPIAPIRFKQEVTYQYAYGKITATPFDSLRVNVTYLWNPQVRQGNLPFSAITTTQPVNTFYAGQYWGPSAYSDLQGGRTSSNNFTAQGDWTPTSKLTTTFRYGRSFLNEKIGNYALANEPRYRCLGDSGAYSTYTTGCVLNFQNLSSNSITTRDVSIKNEFTADASYIASGFFGSHLFKGGYQHGKIENDVLSGYAGTGIVQLYYGQDYSTAGTGVSLPCALNTASCIGVGTLTRFGAKGVASNKYQAIYVQDKWQPISQLTLNLGVRFESENLPAFNTGEGMGGQPISFGWGDKIAPRLGFAWDPFGKGRTKIYGSYGWFFDRLKFELPRGSFGGNFYRIDYFPITQANSGYSYYTPSRILGSFTDPIGGGNPSTSGGLSQLQRDFRIPSNLTRDQFIALGLEPTGVAPDLKAFRQDELTFGFDHELTNSYVFQVRYTNKKVAHAIEDHAILGLRESEAYWIGNPGEGTVLEADTAAGYAKSTKPERVYNGLEFVLNKRLSHNYFFNVNYTLSGLYGNYSGLASSDENGRTSPGVNRFFDYIINGFTATGETDNGYLATDRRHAFKAYGGYSFNWWGSKSQTTDFSIFQQVLQGTPQTTFISVVATSVPLSKRGDMGRTPTYYQTDLGVTHRFKFGNDNRYALVGDLYITNALNNNAVTRFINSRYRVSNTITGSQIDPCYSSNYDPVTGIVIRPASCAAPAPVHETLTTALNMVLNGQIGPQLAAKEATPRNLLYGEAASYQEARGVRFGIRFIF